MTLDTSKIEGGTYLKRDNSVPFDFLEEVTAGAGWGNGNGTVVESEALRAVGQIGSQRDGRLDWELLGRLGEDDWEPPLQQ